MFAVLKDTLRKCSQRRAVRLVAVVMLAATALTVSARTWLSFREARTKSVAMTTAPETSASAQAEQGVIRLLTSGFNPTSVTGSAGQYRLAVTRVSRDEEVVLQLKSSSGEIVQEIRMPQEQTDWTTVIEIESGSYSLTVTNHPDWVCNITVQ
jgi:hypothetical protein